MSAQVHALKAINSRVEAPEEGAALFGPVPFKVYTQRDLERIPQLARLSPAQRFEMKVVSSVLPFRVNQYVIDELIDFANPLQATLPVGWSRDADFRRALPTAPAATVKGAGVPMTEASLPL